MCKIIHHLYYFATCPARISIVVAMTVALLIQKKQRNPLFFTELWAINGVWYKILFFCFLAQHVLDIRNTKSNRKIVDDK